MFQVPDDGLAELLAEERRLVAAESLGGYCGLMWPEEPAALHHRLWISALQDVAEGRCKRLLLTAPPGSAKTAYTSVRFASWYRGRFPGVDIISASHTQELADKSGRRVRNTCQGGGWGEVFPGSRVSGDSTAVNRWTMQDGGDFFGVGVGGLLPGRRAQLFLGDDIQGGIADAMNSRVTRQTVRDWYVGDVLPRLKPDAAQVIVGTCFHSEDFIGYIRGLHESGVEEWRIINLPWSAEAGDALGRAPGERLWPEYFTDEMEQRARRDVDTWMALYQQRPIVESGSYFKREWVREYERGADGLPVGVAGLRIYGSSDYAVTQGGGDWTVHLVVGVAEDGRIYLLDCWRGHESPEVWIAELVRLAKKWKPLEWFEEKGQIARGLGGFLSKALSEEQVYVYRTQYAMPRGADGLNSKQVGAQSIRGRMAQGMVQFPRGAWWLADAVAEMMAFPTEKRGVSDDWVDALSLLGRGLDMMQNATVVKAKKPVQWHTPLTMTISQMVKNATRKRLEAE